MYEKYCAARNNFYCTVRPWLYQLCMEFGYFSTTSSESIFGTLLSLDFYINKCTDLYDD